MLLVVNISLSMLILVITMTVSDALDFSIFPSLLLITTLFRLGLNVSTTRQILWHGYAGSVIQNFGNLITGGNIVVGVVIFLIIVLVQFIVSPRAPSAWPRWPPASPWTPCPASRWPSTPTSAPA